MDLSTKAHSMSLLFLEDFPWWNNEKIKTLKPYKCGKEDKFWEYLRYDKANNKTYFEVFSI